MASKIGKHPVSVPQGVTVTPEPASLSVTVKGPKGELTQHVNGKVRLEIRNSEVFVTPTDSSKEASACHGLYRSLIHNMIVGVTEGFSKTLVITGVGYRAEVQGKLITLNLGYSTVFVAVIPDGLTASVDKDGRLTISGIDKQLVGEFCSQIRRLRKPEPYKGKGIRYADEVIRRKVGKTGVK